MKLLGVLACLFLAATTARADNFSFTGNFTQDDDVQLFNFTVGAPSNVTFQSWSYAGGVNAAGNVIARGGFDSVLAVFDSTGAIIGFADDGSPVSDPLNGVAYDTFLNLALAAGNYTVAVMQYDNFPVGGNLSNGFTRDGQGNFTPGLAACGASQFCDVSGTAFNARDGHWAFDILNVEGATETSATPEPTTFVVTGSGLGLVALWMRRRKA